MAKQREVIGPRTHNSRAVYTSWIRKIGTSTYRFNVSSRADGRWEVRVDRSLGRGWETVHHWPTGNEED
jgi:hypothetical protein